MWKTEYEKWKNYNYLDEKLRFQLENKSEKELEDMFYTTLSFGTGGMRGILGPGINRMNIYTIRRANAGLAQYLVKQNKKEDLKRGVVVAFDNRLMSREFALESAKVLGTYGIKTYLFYNLRPTPELSFAVRELHALAGIVITASHNPPQYNGYKIYDEYGCQYTPRYANEIIKYVDAIKDLFGINTYTFDELSKNDLLEYIGEEIDYKYLANVKSISIHPEMKKPLKIVFTPLHGTSGYLGERLLKEMGFMVYPVKEQMVNDPYFSTVELPNPEDPNAFNLSKKLGEEINADLLIATDPDADRLGIAVKHDGEYKLLNGNQTGALMIYYLLSEKKKLNLLPKKGVVFNTIVTSDLGASIARKFGMDVISTLTGFKFIGEQARYLEKEDREFVFGYEESYGYVVKDFVRDKDSLQAMLMIAEAATYYHNEENKDLYEKLLDIFEEYGYYLEKLHSINLLGKEGKERITRIMDHFRKNHPQEVMDKKIISVEDFQLSKKYVGDEVSEIKLDKSNVLKFTIADNSWFVLRPSGTEPKIKIYSGVMAKTLKEANTKVNKLLAEATKLAEAVK